MLNSIINAINNKSVLSFTYNGCNRVVEPHAVGISRAGNAVLRCFQTEGSHVRPNHEWDLCVLSKITNLFLTGALFSSARPSYAKGDKGMLHIYAEL